MIVVFDFDKTLTYSDSLTDLFRVNSNYVQRVIYFGLKVCSKLGLISVKVEKMVMIKLLFESNEELFSKACRDQVKHLRFSPIMAKLTEYLNEKDRVIVLSASSIYLLREVFANNNVEILGSEFDVVSGKIIGFRQHPFDEEKLQVLSKYGISKVDEAYFDSRHDDCLKSISQRWYRVKNGMIVESNY